MKKYVDNMNHLLSIQYPDSECNCYNQFVLEEEFLCDLCLARLRQHRKKIKHKLRIESKKRYKKWDTNFIDT